MKKAPAIPKNRRNAISKPGREFPRYRTLRIPSSITRPATPQLLSYLPNLPHEILLLIIASSDPISRITLALSCKQLLHTLMVSPPIQLRMSRFDPTTHNLATTGGLPWRGPMRMELLRAIQPRLPTRSLAPHGNWHICEVCFKLRPTDPGYWAPRMRSLGWGWSVSQEWDWNNVQGHSEWQNVVREFRIKRSGVCPECWASRRR